MAGSAGHPLAGRRSACSVGGCGGDRFFAARDAEGNPLDEMTTQDFQLELKEDNFIPGFVAGIVGMQLDETKEIAATFPRRLLQKRVGQENGYLHCLPEGDQGQRAARIG
jgi:hypothetical protein